MTPQKLQVSISSITSHIDQRVSASDLEQTCRSSVGDHSSSRFCGSGHILLSEQRDRNGCLECKRLRPQEVDKELVVGVLVKKKKSQFTKRIAQNACVNHIS